MLLTQQTFCPAEIVAVLGLNVNELVAVIVALAPELAQSAGGVPPPPPPYGDVEPPPPHETSNPSPSTPDELSQRRFMISSSVPFPIAPRPCHASPAQRGSYSDRCMCLLAAPPYKCPTPSCSN